MPGPHSMLGVSPDATEQEIRRAYRKNAMLLHPDKNGGSVEAKENFIALQEAFERLTAQDEHLSEPVQSATARAASPPLGPRRYGSPPPARRRRSRSTSPPIAKPRSEDEPVFEERRPWHASPLRGDKSQQQERRDPFRTSSPRTERKSEPRRKSTSKEEAHWGRRSPPSCRVPSPVYESRKPHRTSSPSRAGGDRRKSTNKPNCVPVSMLRKQQTRDAPSRFVVPVGTQPLTLPRPGKLDELNSEANKLVREIQSSLRRIIVWLENTIGLEKHKDRMQYMYETREDAMSLARQQQRHETLTAELHCKRAWSLGQYHSEIIDLEHDIKELVSILRLADGDLFTIAKRSVAREGSRFDKERDWSAQRRNSLWDGIDRFRAQVRPLLRTSNVRTTSTTIRYKVKY